MAFRELIFTNFRRKLFALLMAILVWFTIHFADLKKRQAAARDNSSTNAPTLIQ
jgi:hypothetical protein